MSERCKRMAKSIQKSLGKAVPGYWLTGKTAHITAAAASAIRQVLPDGWRPRFYPMQPGAAT